MTLKKAPEDVCVDVRGQTWNRLRAKVEAMESQLKELQRFGSADPSALQVENHSGRDVAAFEIVAIGDPIALPGDVTDDLAYQFENTFRGESTDSSTIEFGIAQEGIPADIGGGARGFGLIKTDGVSSAIVNVSNASHGFAKPSSTDGELESSGSGPLKILYKQGTGVQTCKVKFVSGESELIRIKMIKSGGSDGADTAENTWTYVVLTPQDELIETGITLSSNGLRHDYKTFERGEVYPATAGLAYYNDAGLLVIYSCNERDVRKPCPVP